MHPPMKQTAPSDLADTVDTIFGKPGEPNPFAPKTDRELLEAAAPELLDALETLLEASGDNRSEPAQLQALAAIAKAKGEVQ